MVSRKATSGVFFSEFDGRVWVIRVCHEFCEIGLTVREYEDNIVDVAKI